MKWYCWKCGRWMDKPGEREIVEATHYEPAEYDAVCVECGSDEIEQLDRCEVCDSPVSVCGGCE